MTRRGVKPSRLQRQKRLDGLLADVSQLKAYPFEVQTLVGGKQGVVLSNQVKSLDWRVRQAKKKGAVTDEVLEDVRAKIKALMQIG